MWQIDYENLEYFKILIHKASGDIYHRHTYRDKSGDDSLNYLDTDSRFLVYGRDVLECTDCTQTFPSLKLMRTVQALKNLKK